MPRCRRFHPCSRLLPVVRDNGLMTADVDLPDPILSDPSGTIDWRLPAAELPPRTKVGQRVRHETHLCGGTISVVGDAAWDRSSLWECEMCGHRARRNPVWTGP